MRGLYERVTILRMIIEVAPKIRLTPGLWMNSLRPLGTERPTLYDIGLYRHVPALKVFHMSGTCSGDTNGALS